MWQRRGLSSVISRGYYNKANHRDRVGKVSYHRVWCPHHVHSQRRCDVHRQSRPTCMCCVSRINCTLKQIQQSVYFKRDIGYRKKRCATFSIWRHTTYLNMYSGNGGYLYKHRVLYYLLQMTHMYPLAFFIGHLDMQARPYFSLFMT